MVKECGLLLVTQNLIFLDTFIYKSINNKVNNNINYLKINYYV